MLVIFLLAYLAAFGAKLGSFELKSLGEQLNYGLDIEGGVAIVFEADTALKGKELDAAVKQSIDVLSKRIDSIGLTEPKITQQGTNRIRIELPGVKDASAAIQSIGQTAQLEFVLVEPTTVAMEGMSKSDFTSTPILTGKQVKDSKVSSDSYGKPAVGLEFDKEGTELFSTATKQAMTFDNSRGGQIAILLDNKVISAPYTNIQIVDGKAIIVGNFTYDEASVLCSLIRGGALPINLKEVQSTVIGATLGLNALTTSVFAAKIGFLLVALFMIIYYKFPGLVSVIALVLYATIVLALMTALHATLTLPGIAGIVLSVGMAVDANVIIFERVKEELKEGKSLRAAVDSGFHRALTTILDSNITTLIAASVLYYFGTGTIQGFAVTLMIGILTSMFTAIVVTRHLLKWSLGFKVANNTKYYGA